VTRPSNEAVLTNSVVVFTCTTDSTSNRVLINWFYTAVGAASILIATNCDVLQQHQSVYRIEGAAPGVCNLTVNSVQLTNAGTYSCQDVETAGPFSTAELVVLGKFLLHCNNVLITSLYLPLLGSIRSCAVAPAMC